VRERLKEHSFDLPEELENVSTTDALRSPAFEHRDQLKKQKSNLQMLAQLSSDEQHKTAAPKQSNAAAAGTSVSGIKDFTRHQLDGTIDSVAASPQSNAMPGGRILRKAAAGGGGGTIAISSSNHHNADIGGSDSPLMSNLAVAGSGLGPRVHSSGRLQSSSSSSHRAGEAIMVQAAAVRGSRVRGPSFQNRVPSEKVTYCSGDCPSIPIESGLPYYAMRYDAHALYVL